MSLSTKFVHSCLWCAASAFLFLTTFPLNALTSADAAKYMAERQVQRLALVLANWDYDEVPLAGTDKDLETVERSLKKLGFEVTSGKNFRNQEELVHKYLNPFLDKVMPGDFAVIYFSGHGLSLGSENYPVPTKLPRKITADNFTKYFVSVEEFHRKLTSRQPGISLVILDACRKYTGPNIIGTDGKEKTMDKGLVAPASRMTTNMALIYAAEPGRAAVVKGDQSIFTKALVETLESGLNEYNEVKREVNSRVLDASGELQLPWYSESPTAVIWFRETQETLSSAKTSWINALNSGAVENVRRFKRQYPASRHANAATEWLRDFPDGTAMTTSPVPPQVMRQAWESQGRSATFALANISAHYQFARKSEDTGADWRALEWAGFESRAGIAAMMAASPSLQTARPQAMRSSPSTDAMIVATLPKGARLTVNGVITDASGNAWLRVKIPTVDAPVFLEPPPAVKRPTIAVVGIPVVEGFVSSNLMSANTLVRIVDVYKLIAEAKANDKPISWASIEAGLSVCSAGSGKCPVEDDRLAMRMLHAEALLVDSGLARGKITSLTAATDVPPGQIRVRLFQEK